MSAVVQAKGVERPVPKIRAIKDRLIKVLTELLKESDRAVCVLAAAYLEELLGECIRKSLIAPHNPKEDWLLNRTLSSLRNKIEMCYRLGLIDEKTVQALHEIRKLRNDFAHNTFLQGSLRVGAAKKRASLPDLESPHHRNRINRIVQFAKDKKTYQEGLKHIGKQTARAKFLAAVVGIAIEIELTMFRAKPIPNKR